MTQPEADRPIELSSDRYGTSGIRYQLPGAAVVRDRLVASIEEVENRLRELDAARRVSPELLDKVVQI